MVSMNVLVIIAISLIVINSSIQLLADGINGLTYISQTFITYFLLYKLYDYIKNKHNSSAWRYIDVVLIMLVITSNIQLLSVPFIYLLVAIENNKASR